MKRVLSGLLIIALAATLAVSCGGKAGAAKGVEFIMNNGAEPQTLDPSKIQGVPEHRVFMALFEGLVGSDPKTSLAVPGVAESWTVSDDGMQITYKLRKANWSDGTKITAHTVVDSWLRTLNPETASEYAYMVGMVVKGADEYNGGSAGKEAVQIRALDDYTFQCDLIGPMPYAVDMMSHYSFAILPMHVINAKGEDWIKVENFVGNGPFTLDSWKPQESLTVVPNPKYWDAKAVNLSKVTFLPIDDNLTAYNKFKAGEIDWSTGIALDLIDEIKLRPDYQVAPQVATYYYIFNVTRKPFSDVRVRKALTMALNAQELVDKVTKGGQLPTSAMVPTMAGYTPAKGPEFNVEEARKLLAEAGFPDGKGFPKTPLLYNTNDGHKKIAEWAQENWKKNLGIEVTLVNQEWKTFLDTRSVSHDFDVARAGWVGDYLDPNTFLDMFITGSGNNDGLYSNPEYDALVRKAATMKAGPERMAVMQQAESFLITKDQAVLPFYHYVEQDMIDLSKWDGWFANPLGSHPLKYVKLKN